MSFWSRIERRLSDLADELLPDEAHQHVTAARDLLERGMAADAVEVLDTVLSQRPDYVYALWLHGEALLELGRCKEAAESFARAVAARPDMSEALLGLGQAHFLLGHGELAVDTFRGAVAAARGDRAILAAAYRGLGMAYRRTGDLDKAIRELRKAVAEDEDDPLARAALGEALLADERVSSQEAKRHLQRAAAQSSPPALAFVALGQIALEEADHDRARAFFAKALEDSRGKAGAPAREHSLAALEGLGDVALARGDARDAHQHYVQALELSNRDTGVHARIGDAHRLAGNLDAALASYERALASGRDAGVLRRALETALLAGNMDAAVRLANDVLADNPHDSLAMVARGVALATAGQTDAARATFTAALRRGDDVEAHLALGRLELDADSSRGAGARAAMAALAALQVDPLSERARALLTEARARELGEDTVAGAVTGDAGEVYQLAERMGRLAQARSDLGELAGEAARAAADFDQPLLVTVMGEFSSGKSSFVNAFIGEDVAPTGITPTTATINVVKYGRERGGRIVYRDGRTETMSWQELFAALRGLGPDGARGIEVVEILLPLEQLERVNIVDTPGLNSILPEHEEVARGFIARADAVLWLFTASQAGKASERKALERIRGEGKRVLGVLNKKDQLSDADTAELIRYVQGELGELVEHIVPFSARRALEHKRVAAQDSGGAADDGNWVALAEALEQRFFAQARQLKLEACSRRLASMLSRARGVVDEQAERAKSASLDLAEHAGKVLAAGEEFIDRVVAEQRVAVSKAVEDLHRRAAREVLELVRPRELPFGSHRAAPADRDYLLSLLDTGYEAALEGVRRAVVATLRSHAGGAVTSASRIAVLSDKQAASDVARTADDAIRLVEAQVFDRTRAYVRGYLSGGYVAGFFQRDLPKLELDEDTVYQALVRDAPDLDAEMAVPLAGAGAEALESVARRLRHWSQVAEIMAYDIETGIGRALAAMEERRRVLTGARERSKTELCE